MHTYCPKCGTKIIYSSGFPKGCFNCEHKFDFSRAQRPASQAPAPRRPAREPEPEDDPEDNVDYFDEDDLRGVFVLQGKAPRGIKAGDIMGTSSDNNQSERRTPVDLNSFRKGIYTKSEINVGND